MDFIATYWWIWLVGLIASGGYALNLQFKKMKSMRSSFEKFDIKGAQNNIFSGLGRIVIAGFIAYASGALLVISVIIHIIKYYKGIG